MFTYVSLFLIYVLPIIYILFSRSSKTEKMGWSILVLLFSLIGFAAFLIFGNKKAEIAS